MASGRLSWVLQAWTPHSSLSRAAEAALDTQAAAGGKGPAAQQQQVQREEAAPRGEQAPARPSLLSQLGKLRPASLALAAVSSPLARARSASASAASVADVQPETSPETHPAEVGSPRCKWWHLSLLDPAGRSAHSLGAAAGLRMPRTHKLPL